LSYLLDTNVLSEIRKGRNCNPQVRRWWSGVEETDVYVSVMVLGEIRRGIDQLRARHPAKGRALENWMQSVIRSLGTRVLVVERKVAEVWGTLSAKRTLPVVDGLLAATALTHDLTLATRNTRDIADCGVRLLNPFEP
jgi:toxin FitB